MSACQWSWIRCTFSCANIIREVTSGLRRARFAEITLDALNQTLSDGAEVAVMVKNSAASWLNSLTFSTSSAVHFLLTSFTLLIFSLPP
jgi:hypothetical protein